MEEEAAAKKGPSRVIALRANSEPEIIPQAILGLIASRQATIHAQYVELADMVLDIRRRLANGAAIADGNLYFDLESGLVRRHVKASGE